MARMKPSVGRLRPWPHLAAPGPGTSMLGLHRVTRKANLLLPRLQRLLVHRVAHYHGLITASGDEIGEDKSRIIARKGPASGLPDVSSLKVCRMVSHMQPLLPRAVLCKAAWGSDAACLHIPSVAHLGRLPICLPHDVAPQHMPKCRSNLETSLCTSSQHRGQQRACQGVSMS